MKIAKFLTAGALAVAFAGMASAQTTIYITGSTAFRPQTISAILSLLGSSNATSASPTLPPGSGYIFENSDSDVHKTNAQTFKGLTVNGTTPTASVIIKTSWSGSAAGIQAIATTGIVVNYLPVTGYTIPTDGTGSNKIGGTVNVLDPRDGTNAHESVTLSDIAMADNFQAATPFNGTYLGHVYADLTDTDNIVGIVPFQWVKSKGAAAGITNITPQIAQAQWTGTGKLPLSVYTGNPADTADVYATGRNIDSGTRITAFAETAIGIGSTVNQWRTDLEENKYPATSVNGVPEVAGMGGESSGGKLADNTHMGKPGLAHSYVAYMSTGDASTLVGNGGATLSYNGVSYTAPAQITEGVYTFWGYEHLFLRPSITSGIKFDTASDLVAGIDAVPGIIRVSDMHVSRAVDGGTIFHN